MFRHPHAGIQIPAGTVEENKDITHAVLREAREETGLTDVIVKARLGHLDERPLLDNDCYVVRHTRVYARPDVASFDWAEFRRGLLVKRLRQSGDLEWNQFPDPEYVTYRITGWIKNDLLCAFQRRRLFHLTTPNDGRARWTVPADQPIFELFWAPLASLPPIIEWQYRLLAYARDDALGYTFDG